MKKAMLLAAFVVACAPKEEPASDTAAMAGPTALAPTDIAGTWSGMTMMEASDSVLVRWTIINPTGTEAKGVFEGSPDTITFNHTFDADSFVGTSSTFTDPTLPGKPQVMVRAVGRLLSPGKLAGTSTTMLASKPDSVLARSRWEATKTP
jgi:hypothetical protein